MDDLELFERLRMRRADPSLRIDMKTIPLPELFPPARADDVAAVESVLGVTLPTLLARIYLEVGNGGFGPAGGQLGIGGGYRSAEGKTLTEAYAEMTLDGWPPQLLPLWDWGDAMWSCVDAQSESIVTHDETGATRTKFTLRSWLEAWVADVNLFDEMYELIESSIINPFTKKPVPARRRGAPKGTPWRSGIGS